jgi:colanic acid/amylovoran biosynthesis protein
MNMPARRDQSLILLPQALGPFNNPAVSSVVRQLFQRASLVCARDDISLEAARPLCAPSKLKRYPDFTVGVDPELPPSIKIPDQFVAIVPNLRMLDKSDTGGDYIRFLLHAIEFLKRHGVNPVFVLHDADEDRCVIEEASRNGASIPILEHSDPRVLKGMLGRASFVIGSRFHALVSSLSQGIPCLGAGWSHKYPELFKDFDCPDLLLFDLANLGELDQRLRSLVNVSARAQYRAHILKAANRIKTQTLDMWREVEVLITKATR